MNSDMIIRGLTSDQQFRIFAVEGTSTVQQARDKHDLSPVATLLFGKMICAAAMLSWDLKRPEAELTLRMDGKGELEGAMVICNGLGHVRGYAFRPHLFLDNPVDNLHPGKAMGEGTLTVIRYEPNHTPHSGTVELVTGEVAEDLAYYYQQSEQTPSAVNLGVLIDQNAKVRSAGGFIIQQLPQADPKAVDRIIENIGKTPNISDLMDMGLSMTDILNRFVLHDYPWQITETRELVYQCNCSRQRMADALTLLGKTELQTMAEGISPVCHYCNTEYHFSHDDMLDIIAKAKL